METPKKIELHLSPESLAALIAERCYKDADFRRKFLADPRAAIEKMAGGKSLPEDLQVIAKRNDDKHWYIPIPSPKAGPDRQLSEAELERISAGEVGFAIVFGGAVGAAAVAVSILGALQAADVF